LFEKVNEAREPDFQGNPRKKFLVKQTNVQKGGFTVGASLGRKRKEQAKKKISVACWGRELKEKRADNGNASWPRGKKGVWGRKKGGLITERELEGKGPSSKRRRREDKYPFPGFPYPRKGNERKRKN